MIASLCPTERVYPKPIQPDSFHRTSIQDSRFPLNSKKSLPEENYPLGAVAQISWSEH
jgi:hypothetical protein